MLTWLRELAATVAVFDRSALEPGYALRCTLGVAIPLALATLAGNPASGVPAAIGAFITGFTSLQGIYRTRLTAVLAAALGMSVTSFVGAVAAHSTPGLVVATVLAAYAFATIGQLGPAASTVALNSFVAFILFSSQALAPAAALRESVLVLGGGVIQALLLLMAWPTARRGVERVALAEVYRKLAVYARSISQGAPPLPPITPLATARQVLADPQPFARAGEMARFNRLLEDSEIVRKRLGALALTASSDGERSAAIAAAGAAADDLETVARVLSEGGEPDADAVSSLSSHPLQPAEAADIFKHLRDAIEAATMVTSGKLPRLQLWSKPRPGPYVQNHVDFFARDSLRFAVVLGVAMILGRHFAADRGYWIPLTAALVLKPDFQTTFVRGFARIAGTIVGAIVASGVLVGTRSHPALQNGGILLAAAAAYLTFNPNYALFTVAITSFVVLVLGMRGLSGATTIDARLLDTLAGGALAMIGYLMLPSRQHERTRGLLAALLEAQCRFAVTMLRAYAMPTVSPRGVDAARTEIWKIRTAAEASIDRTRSEPGRHHSIGAARALRILAATQRFGLTSLALESTLEIQRPASLDWLVPLADALDADIAELAAALRESRRGLRPLRLGVALEALDAERATMDSKQRLVLERVSAYNDAIARIARLVGERRT